MHTDMPEAYTFRHLKRSARRQKHRTRAEVAGERGKGRIDVPRRLCLLEERANMGFGLSFRKGESSLTRRYGICRW